jgi:hypothetical protein
MDLDSACVGLDQGWACVLLNSLVLMQGMIAFGASALKSVKLVATLFHLYCGSLDLMFSRVPTPSFAVALVIIFLLGPTAHSAGAAVPSGSISGTVASASSGAPIENISVCARTGPVGDASAYCHDTDANGEYTISEIPAGAYRVEFSAGYVCTLGPTCIPQNYVTQYYDGKSSPDESDEVAVAAESTALGINAQMVEGGQITGIVTDVSYGATLEAIEVCALIGGEESMNHCARTNRDGEYMIVGLGSGAYKVEFAHREGCGSPCPIQENFLTQFYNDKLSTDEAEPVSVTAGSTTSGIDARLVEGGKISGVVTSTSEGTPIEGIDVCAFGIDGVKQDGCASTGTTGEYRIKGLPSGSYEVMFSASRACKSTCPLQNYITQYYSEESSASEAKPVSVIAENITTGIDAQMATGGQITGRVTNSSGSAPIEGIEVCAFQNGEQIGNHCAATNADGEYTLSALPNGSYQVEFSAEGGFECSPKCAENYVPQYYDGKLSMSEAESVSVTAGSTTSGIDAVMVEGARQLLGPSHGPLADTIGGGPRPPVPIPVPPTSALVSSVKMSDSVRLDASTVGLQDDNVVVKLKCSGVATCAGRLTLAARMTTHRDEHKHTAARAIGSGVFSVPAGHTKTARLGLNALGRALLRADHSPLEAVLTIFDTSPGPVGTWSENVELAAKTKARK